jgi:uncharacterized protein (TIRG00374 family)
VFRSRGAITLEGFSWQRLSATILDTNPVYLLVALAAIFAAYALRSLRWIRLCRYHNGATFANVFPATIMGFSGILLLGRAGEPLRPLIIARKDRLPVSNMFGVYVIERLFDSASTAVVAGLSLLIFPAAATRGEESLALLAAARTTGTLLLVGLIAAISFLVYFRFHGAAALERRMAEWKTRPGWHAKVAGLFSGFASGLGAIRTVNDLAVALGLTAAHWLLIVYIYLWVMHAFPGNLGELNLTAAMLVLAFTMVGSALQLPGIGGGSQVASFLAFTAVFGVEKEPAAAASIVLWLITFAAVGVVGVPLLIREGWSMGELRRLARAEAAAEAVGAHIPDPELAVVASTEGGSTKDVQR